MCQGWDPSQTTVYILHVHENRREELSSSCYWQWDSRNDNQKRDGLRMQQTWKNSKHRVDSDPQGCQESWIQHHWHQPTSYLTSKWELHFCLLQAQELWPKLLLPPVLFHCQVVPPWASRTVDKPLSENHGNQRQLSPHEFKSLTI